MRRFLVVLSCILLTACAVKPTRVPAATWQLRAKLHISDGQRAAGSTVTWKQQGTQYEIAFLSPLGTRLAQLCGNPQQVQLCTTQGCSWATSPERLLAQELNWDLPISGLQYWIRGQAAPHMPFQATYLSNQRFAHLRQGGWDITYLSYDSQGLPRDIRLEQAPWRIQIKLLQWHAA